MLGEETRWITLVYQQRTDDDITWRSTDDSMARLVTVRNLRTFLSALRKGIANELIERVVIDSDSEPLSLEALLGALSSRFRGDVIYLSEGKTKFSTIGRNNSTRATYSMPWSELEFYLEIHDLERAESWRACELRAA